MSYPPDDICRVHELTSQGASQCEIERHTGIDRNEVRRILGLDGSQGPPKTNGDLSIRERQQLLNGMAA